MLNRHFVSHSSNEGPIPLNTQEDDGTWKRKKRQQWQPYAFSQSIGLQSMSHWFENGRGIAGWLLDFELSSLLTFFFVSLFSFFHDLCYSTMALALSSVGSQVSGRLTNAWIARMWLINFFKLNGVMVIFIKNSSKIRGSFKL